MLVETHAGTMAGLKPRSSRLRPASKLARVSFALPAGAGGGIAEGCGCARGIVRPVATMVGKSAGDGAGSGAGGVPGVNRLAMARSSPLVAGVVAGSTTGRDSGFGAAAAKGDAGAGAAEANGDPATGEAAANGEPPEAGAAVAKGEAAWAGIGAAAANGGGGASEASAAGVAAAKGDADAVAKGEAAGGGEPAGANGEFPGGAEATVPKGDAGFAAAKGDAMLPSISTGGLGAGIAAAKGLIGKADAGGLGMEAAFAPSAPPFAWAKGDAWAARDRVPAINEDTFPIGRGTTRGSCGDTGPWKSPGQTR